MSHLSHVLFFSTVLQCIIYLAVTSVIVMKFNVMAIKILILPDTSKCTRNLALWVQKESTVLIFGSVGKSGKLFKSIGKTKRIVVELLQYKVD